ncbi:MAG: prolyl oligopeptidase family serine peptidase [Planctomycetaceae bacterium]|jgi:hypothetical protein|nr:prolyl oligopeptidase family serine peptidase [Planctomycetaceae bacterium]
MNAKSVLSTLGTVLVFMLIVIGVIAKFAKVGRIMNYIKGNGYSSSFSSGSVGGNKSYLELRDGFVSQMLNRFLSPDATNIVKPNEFGYVKVQPPFRVVQYTARHPISSREHQTALHFHAPLPTDEVQRNAFLYVPQPELANGVRYKRPALVYFHGGFGLSPEETKVCQKFVDDGFVVMLPQLRGEESSASFQLDKEGHYELLMGEVDDAVDAIRWLSQKDYVDSNRIFAFGHSIGGGISALLSLQADVPICHSGSSGGLYHPEFFKQWKANDSGQTPEKHIVRFDPNKNLECRLRVLFGNIKWMQRRHIAYIGVNDAAFDESVNKMTDEAKKEGKTDLFQVERLQGDHFTSLEPAIESYRQLIQSELSDDYAKPLEVKTDELNDNDNEKRAESQRKIEEGREQTRQKMTPEERKKFLEEERKKVKAKAERNTQLLRGMRNRPEPPEEPRQPEQSQSDQRPPQNAQTPPKQPTNPFANPPSNTPPNRESNHSSLPVRKADMLGIRKNGTEFSEDVPKNAILVGFDVSLGKWGASSNNCIASIQPLYRAKDSEKAGKGKILGNATLSTQRVYAPSGYAVGAIQGRAVAALDGFRFVYMKIKPDGALDPNDQQTSDWVGGSGGGMRETLVTGNGQPVSKISGFSNDGLINSLKLEF